MERLQTGSLSNGAVKCDVTAPSIRIATESTGDKQKSRPLDGTRCQGQQHLNDWRDSCFSLLFLQAIVVALYSLFFPLQNSCSRRVPS